MPARIEVWEFFGNGDPFFGGSADDRILHWRKGMPVMLSSHQRCPLDRRATFETIEEAEDTLQLCPVGLGPRDGGLISFLKSA